MKKVFLLGITSLLIYPLYAKNSTFNGATALEDMTFESITVNGSFKGKNLVIKDKAHVNGACACKKSEIGTLHVSGACKVKNSRLKNVDVAGALQIKESQIQEACDVAGAFKAENIKVQGKTSIKGACEIQGSTLQELVWLGREAEIEDCTVASIHAKKTTEGGVQTLELKGKTVVQGNVTFDDESARLEIDEEVEIKGDVIKAGKVIPKDEIQKEEKSDDDKKESKGFFCRLKKWVKKIFRW